MIEYLCESILLYGNEIIKRYEVYWAEKLILNLDKK